MLYEIEVKGAGKLAETVTTDSAPPARVQPGVAVAEKHSISGCATGESSCFGLGDSHDEN
jgi:hypothetical protein